MGQINKPDFATVSGTTPDFANVQGGMRSTEAPAAGAGDSGQQSYTVASGDTLSAIAMQVYGKPHWRPIFDANRDQLDDPDEIRPGQVLNIPPA